MIYVYKLSLDIYRPRRLHYFLPLDISHLLPPLFNSHAPLPLLRRNPY